MAETQKATRSNACQFVFVALQALKRNRNTVDRPFAILKQVMALRRFSCRGFKGMSSEMAIAVLSYNLR